MAMSRFTKPPSVEDLDNIVDAAVPQNTKYSTKFGMNVFNGEFQHTFKKNKSNFLLSSVDLASLL